MMTSVCPVWFFGQGRPTEYFENIYWWHLWKQCSLSVLVISYKCDLYIFVQEDGLCIANCHAFSKSITCGAHPHPPQVHPGSVCWLKSMHVFTAIRSVLSICLGSGKSQHDMLLHVFPPFWCVGVVCGLSACFYQVREIDTSSGNACVFKTKQKIDVILNKKNLMNM